MSNTKKISKVLHQISGTLNNFIQQDEKHGLLNGYSGVALFYAYYYKLTAKKKYLNTLNCIIEKTINALANENLIYSHCSGISGMGWCIQHLLKNGFIEQVESENIFEELDAVLFNTMRNELSENQYDFLHQGLGITLYFLDKRPETSVQNYLEEVVILLERAVIIETDGISWRDTFIAGNESSNKSTYYNLGMAHGVPAILSILSILYEKGISVVKTLNLIENGVNWLLSTRNKPDKNCASLFPTMVTDSSEVLNRRQSRLGWCYGDLSIGISLLNIGIRIQNESYKQEAYEIFHHTLKHRNKENGNINDASLCHGSMGVSHIFRRVYMANRENLFLNGASDWLDQTLQMATWKDGLAGFKYFTDSGFKNNYNLLEGITGTGLALIAAIDTDTAPAWDRCLLLS